MIDRRAWVTRHDPVLTSADPASPLTVGNGSLAFTADVTGLQTLYADYAAVTPLCTMADWGWHSSPAPTPSGSYTLDDVRLEAFDAAGRSVHYARTRYPDTAEVYDWLRENPHKADLLCTRLRLNDCELAAADFSDIRQQLHLYSGVLESRWTLRGVPGRVITACDPERDVIALRIECPLLASGLTVTIDFPRGTPDITAADWKAEGKHRTTLTDAVIRREMDELRYAVRVDAPGAKASQTQPHSVCITAAGETLELCLSMKRETEPEAACAADVLRRSADWWARFWQRGGALDLSGAADPRAMELERRIVLSLYLLAVNSSGCMPPAETGLTCNSWYGKAHLEMHFWHMAWAPLWGQGALLERCLPWYHAHLPQARENAARNGYAGARWPKMIADTGVDSPSAIATLLVWQQPHILTLLELLRRTKDRAQQNAFLRAHWPLVRETAAFMADYPVRDGQGVYHIAPPVIPVQERFEPADTVDPAFEVAYWRFGLSLAIRWAEMLDEAVPEAWRQVCAGMATPPVHQGCYIAHADAPETFRTAVDDHPSMLMCLGVLPGEGIDREIMARTLETVLSRWDFSSLWGWDFAVMAMTAQRLGRAAQAVDLLLYPAEKNAYVVSGHNRQADRRDLPLYLPGNGSLLLAAAMLAVGGEGCPPALEVAGWNMRCEGIRPWR